MKYILKKLQNNKLNLYKNSINSFVIFFLVFFSIFNLLVPSQDVLAINDSSTQKLVNHPKITTPVFVKVINSSPVLHPVVNVATSNIQPCNLVLGSGINNLVQKTSFLNLNIPANCYKLEVRKFAPVNYSISVSPLVNNNANLVVVVKSEEISNFNLTPAPFNKNIPILPLVVYSIIFSSFVFNKKNIINKINKITHFEYNINLERLKVYRC